MVAEVTGTRNGPSFDGSQATTEESLPGRTRRTNLLVIFAYCFCCLVWGTTWFVVRQMVSPAAGSSPYLAAAVRFSVGVILFLPLLAIYHRKLRAPTLHECGWLVAAGILNGFYQICVYHSEMYISGGLAAVIASTIPLMVAVLAVATRTEKVSARTIVGFCASFLGVAMVCHDRTTVSWAQTGATLIMVLAAFFNACTNVTLKRASSHSLSPIVSAPFYLLLSAGPIWVTSLMLREPQSLASIPLQTWYGLAYLSVMSSFLAFGLYLYMLKHMSLMAVSTLPFVLPVLALVVDLFLEKNFSLSFESWAGIAVVLVGVVFSVIKR